MKLTETLGYSTQTLVLQLPRLVRDLEHGLYAVPEFQRPFVWTDGQVLDLADSIIRGLPIGPLLVWHRRSPTGCRAAFGGVLFPVVDAPGLVIDGQQRLGAIARLFSTGSSGVRIDLQTGIWGGEGVEGRSLIGLSVYTLDSLFGKGQWDVEDEAVRKVISASDRLNYYTVPMVLLDETCPVEYVVEAFVRLARSGTPIDEEHLAGALKRLQPEE